MPSLHFKGKAFVQNHHLVVPFHELTPVKAKGTSKTASLHDNLIVEGDNLKALKALLPTYHGKVKCVYIDPPYNTGNEGWAYNDAVNSPMMQDWLGKTVDRDDLTRHDKWCCMMLPRLKLLREFLTDDGAIFVSIDDNEVHHLRCLMDDIFGEENFVANIVWKRTVSRAVSGEDITVSHDHIVCYRRSEAAKFHRFEVVDESGYKNPDNDPRGPYKLQKLERTLEGARPTMTFAINTPVGPITKTWACRPETYEEMLADNRIVFAKSGVPYYKQFLSEFKGILPDTWWDNTGGYNQDASRELKTIFGEKGLFPNPKPSELVETFLRLIGDKDSIVMDSFAGSGTTAHAVLALNKEDGGNRRFVLIECEDYADRITAERVRRVAKGVPGAKDEALKAGLGGTFSYFKLGRPMQMSAILEGKALPDFESLARYVFFTATGEEFDAKKINRKTGFIGESRHHDVFLFYTDNPDQLKQLALTLDAARALPSISGKPKLVFAPTKYLDESFLDRLRITFCQLPFQIYKALDV
jgi:adenine-specific DNA-methyltransferase